MAEVLSQSQIDALLNSMQAGGDAESAVEEKVEVKEEKKYKKYDFYSPKKFTRDRLRLLQNIYENYSRVVSSRISSVVRTSSQVELIGIEEQRYYEFANSLNETDVLTLIQAESVEGTSTEPILMKVETGTMLCMIDHMLGGLEEDNGDFSSYTYTDIELSIYQVMVEYMIDVMKDAWSNYIDLTFALDRLETNPTMMQEISRDESVAIVLLDIQVGSVSGNVSICMPDSVLSGIFKILDKRTVKDGADEEERELAAQNVFENIKKTSLEIKAELGKSQLSLRDVYSLQVGDVINLNKPKDSEVYLNIADKTWFRGYLGTSSKNMAIKISGVSGQSSSMTQEGAEGISDGGYSALAQEEISEVSGVSSVPVQKGE